MRLLVVGDVGGHYDQLAGLLERTGADLDSATLPEGTHVIQVGDLIDRGPRSADCVALADRFLSRGTQWTQLFGNHEGNRLGARVFWDEPLEPQAVATIRRWWEKGQAQMAVALDTEELGQVLVSHGGLVRSLWSMLGRPDAAGAAKALNRPVGRDPEAAFSSGMLLSGGIPGPAWADAAGELYPSWASAEEAPFAQVHGHAPVLAWPRGRPLRHLPRGLRKLVQPDPDRQHSRIVLGGRPFVCVDPGLGSDAAGRLLAPLVLTGDILG